MHRYTTCINPRVHQRAQTILRDIYMIFASLWEIYRKISHRLGSNPVPLPYMIRGANVHGGKLMDILRRYLK